jgi:hypothetical protein
MESPTPTPPIPPHGAAARREHRLRRRPRLRCLPVSCAREGLSHRLLPLPHAWGRGLGGRGCFSFLLILSLLTGACQQVERIAEVAPRAILPGAGDGPRLPPGGNTQAAKPVDVSLPPAQRPVSFDFDPLDPDAAGNRRFLVRMRPGGSPSLVALEKLTPLFNVDGKGPLEYVTDAFFAANPHRTPRSIQPDDEFVLSLPADTFVVHWQEEQEEHQLGRVRLRAYVSDRGDRLRMYLTERYPILYELESVDTSGTALIRLHPDLAFLLGSGRLDPIALAQLVYRVEHPDLIQVQITRKLAAEVQPGQAAELTVDRTRTYLDPVRQAMTQATIVDKVPDPGRSHLTRAIFIREEVAPFLGIEDALGILPDISQLPAGRVFRIEYGRDGVVKVSYLTGDDDERGRRDPYQLRENERWAAIYDRYATGDAAPVAWGPGEPSDIAPFPTARDPNRRVPDGERSYDYLVANRAIMLTFRPTRTRADTRVEAELAAAFGELGKQYKLLLTELDGWLPELRR